MNFMDGLTLIFIILKLTGYIDWNWFWVLFPLIIQVILAYLVYYYVSRN